MKFEEKFPSLKGKEFTPNGKRRTNLEIIKVCEKNVTNK